MQNASKTSLDRISHSMGSTNVLMKQFDDELQYVFTDDPESTSQNRQRVIY